MIMQESSHLAIVHHPAVPPTCSKIFLTQRILVPSHNIWNIFASDVVLTRADIV